MGYANYTLPDGREAGYGVQAECDATDCTERIDRGLGYLCGNSPDGHRDPEEPGCGRYFCPGHRGDHNCPNPAPTHARGTCPECGHSGEQYITDPDTTPVTVECRECSEEFRAGTTEETPK